MSAENVAPTNQMVHLKQDYPRVLEWAFVVTILLLIGVFYSMCTFTPSLTIVVPANNWDVEVLAPPKTIQKYKKTRPAFPQIPVAGDEDDILPDVAINLTVYDPVALLAYNKPPEVDLDETFQFYAIAHKPKLVKRFAPKYPDMARKAGITGRVVVNVLIGKKGLIEKAELMKSIPMLDEAALDAARKFVFTPGIQRDKKVRVWLSIPFVFTLNGGSSF